MSIKFAGPFLSFNPTFPGIAKFIEPNTSMREAMTWLANLLPRA
jgi:hypothetical protein